jgi:hypothetical protein
VGDDPDNNSSKSVGIWKYEEGLCREGMKFTVHAELIWLIGHLWLFVPVAIISSFFLVIAVIILSFFLSILFVLACFASLGVFLSLTCNW